MQILRCCFKRELTIKYMCEEELQKGGQKLLQSILRVRTPLLWISWRKGASSMSAWRMCLKRREKDTWTKCRLFLHDLLCARTRRETSNLVKMQAPFPYGLHPHTNLKALGWPCDKCKVCFMSLMQPVDGGSRARLAWDKSWGGARPWAENPW